MRPQTSMQWVLYGPLDLEALGHIAPYSPSDPHIKPQAHQRLNGGED